MLKTRLIDAQTSGSNNLQYHAKGGAFAAAFQYTEDHSSAFQEVAHDQEYLNAAEDERAEAVSPRQSPRSTGMNVYTATPDPPPPIHVRALYNYDADDPTSLSFRQGDIIQVLTQLESGWWDGVINNVRGWFPSNYCVIVSGPDDPGDFLAHGLNDSETSAESGAEDDDYDEQDDDLDSEGNPRDEDSDLPIEGTGSRDQEEASFWVPQATPDGRLFYFNTLTGVSTMELPLETPTSVNETGPQDRTNFHVPEYTRPPPELLARGFEHDEGEYDGSASEAEGESLMLSSQESLPKARRSLTSNGISPAISTGSMNASPESKSRNQGGDLSSTSTSMSMLQQAANTMKLNGTTATSFSTPPTGIVENSLVPPYFFDEGSPVRTTWTVLVENMRESIESYRQAVESHERAEFVRRAEDISDHLRMLLAAGSGTTDNHSGNPSIISTNKALYPHFRDMMSRFSKLVLSSHIAAADWPGPDALAKCLQEADGVLHGVYGYVDVARQQRGDELPRIIPGFVIGSISGGNWQNNNIASSESMMSTSFMDQDDFDQNLESMVHLDAELLSRIDDARKVLCASIRRLEDELHLTEKIITVSRHALLGEHICFATGSVISVFKPWIALVESTDLSPLGTPFQNPQLLDFASQKQKVYDDVAELVTSCQSLTAPLADEWAEVRGESLEGRLRLIQAAARQLDGSVSQILYSLQLLLGTWPTTGHSLTSKEHRLIDGGETYQKNHLRPDGSQSPDGKPLPTDVGQSQSSTLGDSNSSEKFRRPLNTADKARRFFGQMPPVDAGARGQAPETLGSIEETPWFLRLDHEREVSYDNRPDPRQLKSGTLTGLVEHLTRHDRLDARFNTTFLLTYRSFTSAAELFEMLVRRFNIQPPAGLRRDDFPVWEDKKQRPVRFRVVNILKSWLETYWMEGNDEGSRKLLERIYAFAKNSVATSKTPGSAPLMTVVEQRMKGQDTSAKRLVLTLTNSAPAPILPKNMKKLKFLDIDATEFARQLTIVESKLYGKIRPTECLNKTWQKKVKPEEPDPAPNVKSLILHSNQLTNWVAEMILSQSEVKKRVVVIKHFVTIADVGPHSDFTG